MALEPEDINQIKTIINEAAHNAANEFSQKQTITVVRATLEGLGWDMSKPVEVQKDNAFVRQARLDAKDNKKTAKDAVIRWSVNGLFVAAVTWFIQFMGHVAPGSGGPFNH